MARLELSRPAGDRCSRLSAFNVSGVAGARGWAQAASKDCWPYVQLGKVDEAKQKRYCGSVGAVRTGSRSVVTADQLLPFSVTLTCSSRAASTTAQGVASFVWRR